jgi:hypothetical protein
VKKYKTPAKEKKLSSAKLKTTFNHTLLYKFAVNEVNDTHDAWTSLKVVLTPLNVNRYQLFKS